MPEQLKIIIDADVNKAIAGVKELSKVISLDFAKSTAAASTAANKLSADVAASIQKINASLSSLKTTSLDVSLNTSSIDASIKNIQSKFAALVDPTVNVLANTELAETKIKELISDLSTLKGSEIFIRANDTQALKVINEVEAELNSLVGKQINLSVTADFSKIEELKAKLSALKVTPVDVSVNTSGIDASIKNIQAKFNALVDPQINVLANTELAETKIKELLGDLSTLKGLEIFIRANDTQALQKINEIEKELSALVGKQIDLRVTADLTKVNELKTKLDTLKVSPVNISVTTGEVDASIKSIQAKFNSLVDPQVNILANTELAEAKIKELLGDLSTLKGSEIFIRANDAQALRVINEVETELNTLLDKQIKLNINTGDATQRINTIETELNSLVGKQIKVDVNTLDAAQKLNLLEKELLNLQTLSVDPKISSTQLSLFEANIKRVKAEIASLKGQGVVVPIAIDTAAAQSKLNILSETIETIRGKIEARKFFITTETDITKIAKYNQEIDRLEAKMRQIQNVGKKGFELFIVPGQTIRSVKTLSESVAAFGGGVRTYIPPAIQQFSKLNTSVHPIIGSLKALEKQSQATGAATAGAFGKAFQGLRSLAALIPGIGLGGIIGLAATAVNQLTEGFFEAAFGASKLDKALDAASEGIDKNAASVLIYVNALKSGTLSTDETKRVQKKLIDQAPEFQTAFKNNKVDVEELDRVLTTKYIPGLIKSIKVTAALGIVNDALAESIAQIAKGGTNFTFGQKIANFLGGLSQNVGIEFGNITKNVEKAEDALKAENITKLIEDTFKSLGISFSDVAGEVDKGGAKLKAALDKQKADFEKFQNEVISKARTFAKEFGSAFIVPNLEESFFVNKNEIFKRSQKLLSDVNLFLQGNIKALKIKIPVQTDFELLPITEPTISQDLIDGFKKSFGGKFIELPVNIILDPSISDANKKAIDDKLKLRKGFSIFGDLGFKEFDKVFAGVDFAGKDFAAMDAAIQRATKSLEQMTAIATTLQQSIGQGLTNAFNSVFDAVLEGRSVFKALGNAIKALVVDTIKAIAQMLILKLVTNLIFPGAGAAGAGLGRALSGIGGAANFGQLSGIGSRAFNNPIPLTGEFTIRGTDLVLAVNRERGSQGRFGG